jgi:DNA-binding CsgD family transcriptional regulator
VRCAGDSGHEHLTARELEVLTLIAAGLVDAEIAVKLDVSVGTVQTHVKHMRRKAGARAKAGLIAQCYATGILLPGDMPPLWSGTYCLRTVLDSHG